MLRFNISYGSPFWDPILKVITNVQYYTLCAAIYAVVGAVIMHSTHAGYNVLWSSRIGAVGGSVLAIPLMLVAMHLERIFPKGSEKTYLEAWMTSWASLAMGAASSIGATALGAKILIASLGAETVKQGIRESAIAGGVGVAVCLAASLAFFWACSIFKFGIVTAMKTAWISVK